MSKRYVWTTEYSVNVPGIDEQHKEFLGIVNSLLDLEESEAVSDLEAVTLVEKLSNYGLYHLSTEEFIFSQINYEGAHDHIAEHNQYRERIKIFVEKIKINSGNKKTIIKELAEFSGNWIMQHILIMDKKYSSAFVEKGIK